jgi:hypothetical protein
MSETNCFQSFQLMPGHYNDTHPTVLFISYSQHYHSNIKWSVFISSDQYNNLLLTSGGGAVASGKLTSFPAIVVFS